MWPGQLVSFIPLYCTGNLDEVFVGYQSYVRDAPAKQKALRVPQVGLKRARTKEQGEGENIGSQEL